MQNTTTIPNPTMQTPTLQDDVATLASDLKHLIERHSSVLNREGVDKDLVELESWLETQRVGPVPNEIISVSGLSWLGSLRDQLKLSADEAQRLEGEGGAPSSKEQIENIEALLKVIRRIDSIIENNDATKHH